MGKKLFVFGLIIGVLVLFISYVNQSLRLKQVAIGDVVFTVDVADTPDLRAVGLSGRTGIERNQGMLFLFDKPDLYGFWMKDMLFPIDIIWIRDKQVVGVTEDLPLSASEFPPVFYAPSFIDAALEIRAGEVRVREIMVGDQVVFLNK